MQTRPPVPYPAPSTDALGKIIGFCGGAGSRTRVRERAVQVATCVSGDLVFVAGLAHRRGILALSLRSFAAAPAGACTAASPLNGHLPGPRAAPRFVVPSAV